MKTYDTVSETVNDLNHRGYTGNFTLDGKEIVWHEKNFLFRPEDFVIDEVYRFEGDTDPADEAIVYALSSLHNHIKCVLVNGYGVSSDSPSNEIIAKIQVH